MGEIHFLAGMSLRSFLSHDFQHMECRMDQAAREKGVCYAMDGCVRVGCARSGDKSSGNIVGGSVVEGSKSMDVQAAVLCDAATDYGGKLNILGTFDTIVAPKLPAVHPQCSIAVRIVFSRIEEGTHKLRMNFVDEDGHSIMPGIDIPAEVRFPPDASILSRNFIVNIQHLKFEKAGHYGIDIALDGRHESSIPLHVRLAPQAPAPGT